MVCKLSKKHIRILVIIDTSQKFIREVIDQIPYAIQKRCAITQEWNFCDTGRDDPTWEALFRDCIAKIL
jgi:hypothetical protein